VELKFHDRARARARSVDGKSELMVIIGRARDYMGLDQRIIVIKTLDEALAVRNMTASLTRSRARSSAWRAARKGRSGAARKATQTHRAFLISG